MALAQRIIQTANKRRRIRAEREGVRLEEIGAVMDIGAAYRKADADSDEIIKQRFQTAYRLADDEEERDAITQLYMEWAASETREEFAVLSTVDDAVTFLKAKNDFWLGAWTPGGSDGAA